MAINLQGISGTIEREKSDENLKKKRFSDSVNKYFEDDKNTNLAVIGKEKSDLVKVINELDHTKDADDYVEVGNALNEWRQSSLEKITDKNEQTLINASYESLNTLIEDKLDNATEYETQYKDLLTTQKNINELKENADMGTFSEIDSVLTSYGEMLDGMYKFIDKQGEVAQEHQTNIKNITSWLDLGKTLQSTDADADTPGMQSNEDYGSLFDMHMDRALKNWIAGDEGLARNSIMLADNSISGESRMRAKVLEELKEQKRNMLLGATDPGTGGGRKGGYIQSSNFDQQKLITIREEVDKKITAENTLNGQYIPNPTLNTNDMELINLLSIGDVEVTGAIKDVEERLDKLSLSDQGKALQQRFDTIDTFFGSGAGSGLISEIDSKLTKGNFKLVNVQPASSSDNYFENEQVRNQLKEGLSTNIENIFKYLDSGLGGFFGGSLISSDNTPDEIARGLRFENIYGIEFLGDNYYDPNDDIKKLLEGDLTKEDKALLMNNIVEIYLGDNKEIAKKMTKNNFDGNEEKGYEMFISFLEAYKALQSMDYLKGQSSLTSGRFDTKK
jgi:hypothetical protein